MSNITYIYLISAQISFVKYVHIYICGNIIHYRQAKTMLYYVTDRRTHSTTDRQPFTTFLYLKL